MTWARGAIEVGLVVGFALAVRYVHLDKPRRGRWLSRLRCPRPPTCRCATIFSSRPSPAFELNHRIGSSRADCLVGSRQWALDAHRRQNKGRLRRAAFALEAMIGDGQNAAIGCLRDRRNPTKPRPAKPASIIAQVDGSGADDGRAPLKRLSLCNSPPPEKLAANTEPEM